MATRPLLRSSLGPHFSEGARLLWLALERLGLNQTEAEARARSAKGSINRLLYGERRPGLDMALRLEEAFGIPPGAWNEPPSEPFAPPAAKVA